MNVIRCLFFFFKQKTAYEMRISDWSSDVCSSDLCADLDLEIRQLGLGLGACLGTHPGVAVDAAGERIAHFHRDLGRARARRRRQVAADRSEERRGGKECASTCRSRRTPCP